MRENRKQIMSVFILTRRCNMGCPYCPEFREGDTGTDLFLTKEVFEIALRVLKLNGLSAIRLTGGEPLLHPHLDEILTIYQTSMKDGSLYLIINTNGLLINRTLNVLKNKSIDQIRISLDGINDIYYNDHNVRISNRQIMNGIMELSKYNIPIRINMVVTKSNVNQIHDMIDFCRSNNTELKLLDLEKNKKMTRDYYQANYISIEDVKKSLGIQKSKFSTVNPWGNLGLKMTDIEIDGVSVRLKDSSISSTYHHLCKSCIYYPCPEGVYGLTITPDNNILWCRRQRERGFGFQVNEESFANALTKVLKILSEANHT